MNRVMVMLLSLGTLCFCPSASAGSVEDIASRLVRCEASRKDVDTFNLMVDQEEIPYAIDRDNKPWGGLAWKLPEPLQVHGMSSSTLIMVARDGFYLRFEPGDIADEVKGVVGAVGMKEVLRSGDQFLYEKEVKKGTISLVSDESGVAYWLGCLYTF